MKVGYFADGPWSHDAIEKLVELEGVEICFITPRFDTQDPVLKDWAQRLGVPFIPHADVNAADFLNQLKEFGADLLISMSFNQILKRPIINAAPLGFINCHAGALPFYRGRNPLNWALINGEEQIGVTVHYIDEGIDTGNIIRQRFVAVNGEDDYGTLLEKSFSVCGDVLIDAVKDIRDGVAQSIPQTTIHPVGFYCGMRRPGDEWIDWSWPSERIHNFVRAIAVPAPGARTLVKGEKEVALLKTELVAEAPEYIATCGEVVGRDKEGVVVKSGSSTLKVLKVADIDNDGNVMEAYVPRFPMGTRFIKRGCDHAI